MKLQLALFFLLFNTMLHAAPGDTTIVVGHQNVQMTYIGWYDHTVQIPNNGVSYRKAYLEYTYGKYVCPGNPQYCGSWDYIVNFTLRPYRAGWNTDSFEIARGITPYATTGTVFPNTWTHTYLEDVTNYEPLFRDSALLKVWFGGYSYGFTISTRLILIEGTPEKSVQKIHKIYPLASPLYGDSASPIDSAYLVPFTTTLSPSATNADLIFRITGHGSNPNDGCGEFCSKYFDVQLDGSNIAHQDIWRTCGYNDIPAQTGTWIFDRANWCPGENVHTYQTKLEGVNPGIAYTVDVNMEPYVYTSSQARYNIEGQVIEYIDNTLANDAELQSILAPSTASDYKKYNPSCAGPVIKLRNAGSNALTQAEILYGIQGSGVLQSHTWQGSLQPGESTIVQLTAQMGTQLWADSSVFVAYIDDANNAPDVHTSNNTQRSIFRTTPTLPGELIIQLRTNNTTASSGTVNETSWKLFDAQGNLKYSRLNNAHNTTYMDTVYLWEGCYKLIVTDSGYADGLSFWYYQYYNTNPGAGYIRLRNPQTGAIIGQSISLLDKKYYAGDFGAGFEYDFKVNYATRLDEHIVSTFEVFPNPAQNLLNIAGLVGTYSYKIYNTVGQLLLSSEVASSTSIDIHTLPIGLHQIVLQQGDVTQVLRFEKE
jgi:hypothetical protein